MTRSSHPIDRRGFVRTTAAGLALLPMVGPDGLRLPRMAKRSRVVLVRTADRKRGVTKVLKLLNPAGIGGKRVVLKPNFNTADDAPGSTHRDTLSQLVTELYERDARSVTLGESSGPPQTRGVMEQKGVFNLARELRFDVVNFEEIPESDWVPFGAQRTHWPEGFHCRDWWWTPSFWYPPAASRPTASGACSPCRSSSRWVSRRRPFGGPCIAPRICGA